MSELRAGLIGFGEMGRHHARVLGQLDGVRLVAVLDPACDGSVAGVPVVHDLSDLLRYDLDLCVVASPTSHHLEHGLTLAEHRGDRCWCVMARPFKGPRTHTLVFSGCQLLCSCRMRCRTENVLYLMGACYGMKVRSRGRMACRSCRVDRRG